MLLKAVHIRQGHELRMRQDDILVLLQEVDELMRVMPFEWGSQGRRLLLAVSAEMGLS